MNERLDERSTPAKVSDAQLTAIIQAVEKKLGIYWYVPDDSETFAWRTTNTNEQRKFARALIDAAAPQAAQLTDGQIALAKNIAMHADEASILAGNEACQRIMRECAKTIRALLGASHE